MARTEAEVIAKLEALGLPETDARYQDTLRICREQSAAAALLWVWLIEVMELPREEGR